MFNELLQLPYYQTAATNSNSDLFYTHCGEGDLLVLIHGSLCDLRYWRWQLNKLQSNCQVAALSLPGCWPSPPNSIPYEFNFENHVMALKDVIDKLRRPNQKVYVLGHSRGAQIAAQYAWQYREISGLILADPAFRIDQWPEPLSVMNNVVELLEQNQDEEGLALFIDAVNGPNTWRQMVGWFRTMVEDNAYTLIPQSREILPTVTKKQITKLTDMPLLLINGAASSERYKNSVQNLLDLLPHAQHAIINNAAHGMNLANPKAFNRTVLDFILP